MKSIWNQIWNQRRANAWIWVELMVVNVLLWYAIDLVYNYEGAAWQPKGYDTERVFTLKLENKPIDIINDKDNSNAPEDFSYLYNVIKEYPGVETVSNYYGTIPYTNEVMTDGYALHTDSSNVIRAKVRYVLPEYFDMFHLKPIAGEVNVEKWKSSEVPTPIAVSKELADSLCGDSWKDIIGKTFFNPRLMRNPFPDRRISNYRVVAVLPNHKQDEYQRYEPFLYLPTPNPYPLWWQHMAIRVHPDHVAGFEERFRKDMQPVLDHGMFYMDYIQSYADMKEAFDIEQGTVNYLNTTYAVIAFFLFNVFLSILGTFWFRTHKRRSEIALRMAMGCSRQGILKHYLTEGWLLLLVAAVPAWIVCFNIQMGDLTVHTLMDVSGGRFIGCFLVAVCVLALIVALGIWFPARQAMKIEPAEALHDE